MSKAIYDYSHQQIELAFEQKNGLYIEKETDYIFTKVLALLSTLHSDKLIGIKISHDEVAYKPEYLFSPKHKSNLFKWLKRLYATRFPASDLDFGKLKVDFETWYYDLGGTSIEFVYHDSYLLKPMDAAAALGISKVTLNKYIKLGLECLDNGSQNKIPKHAVELMKDPVYSIRMQINYQKKKMLEQTPEERLLEITREIAELQLKYGKKTYQEAFRVHESQLDDPVDFYRWKDLAEELDEILKVAGGSGRELKYANNDAVLLPADIDEILEEFGALLENHTKFRDRESVYGSYKRSRRSLLVIFPLKAHPIHGLTGLRAYEKYDDRGHVERYEYRWMVIVPKQGIQLHHITSWANEPHDDPDTPEKFKVPSEPHHHHHDPKNRSERRANYEVRTLRDAFEFIRPYMVNGTEYTGIQE